ncbi:MAG: glycyl-radical enzyme activating protein [Clostridia bacterium]|nr:glycyl-radical enzyme activating protein [Clostridia bacterium]
MQTTPRHLTGRIVNLQHFCVDDGPGIRTTVFFKGCPLRCRWCHNPESQALSKEIMYFSDRCRLCGSCACVCTHGGHSLTAEGHLLDRSRCVRCGECVGRCAFGALEGVGRDCSIDEIMEELLSDRVFYETSGGGVTLSGGEPTMQPDFAMGLLSACKAEGLHTCIETCAYCQTETIVALSPLTDLFLVDWKLTDDDLHKSFTGVSNALIVENLEKLCELGSSVILRCPLIPEVNLERGHLDGIAAIANRLKNITAIDLEPYHPMGIGKTVALGKRPSYENPDFLDTVLADDARAYLQDIVNIPVSIR